MAWCLPHDGSIEFKAAVFLGDLSRKISIIAILFYALSFRLVFRLLIKKKIVLIYEKLLEWVW